MSVVPSAVQGIIPGTSKISLPILILLNHSFNERFAQNVSDSHPEDLKYGEKNFRRANARKLFLHCVLYRI